jgi:hypothetical protein
MWLHCEGLGALYKIRSELVVGVNLASVSHVLEFIDTRISGFIKAAKAEVNLFLPWEKSLGTSPLTNSEPVLCTNLVQRNFFSNDLQ